MSITLKTCISLVNPAIHHNPVESSLRGQLNMSFVLLVFLLFAGCRTSLQAPSNGTQEAEIPADTQVHRLIARLNDSSMENRMARRKLLKKGKQAVPALMGTINIETQKLRSRDKALQAARSLRVLREMETDRTLHACKKILILKELTPSSRHVAALINEALACVYESFERQEARDIFYSFVTEEPGRYLKRVRRVQHWGPAYYQKRVEVDVLRGLRLMVASDDPRTKKALITFLDAVTLGSMDKTYFYRLAENGYSLTQETTSEPAEKVRDLLPND